MTNSTTWTGKSIGDYQLLEIIGDGGFGTVYRAFQASVGRDVAIKMIHPKYIAHPSFVLRFEAEARLIARLEHPYIVPLIDYKRDADSAYIVMRWLRGGSVRKLLQSGPLETESISRLLDQIGSALSVAHRSGIIHRDLKPDNILLDENRNFYLSDFGISKNLSEASNLTPEGIIIGSVPYLTPEQIKQQALTPRTDVYALGVVLYELLTAEHPFAGASHEQIFYKHLHEALPSLTIKRPDLQKGLDSVIERATAKEPLERFASALELSEAFHEVTADQSAASRRGHSGKATEFPLIDPVLKGNLKARLYDNPAAILEKPRRLIGRELLIDKIQSHLVDAERVLLHGLGGIGKTSLAATIAAQYIAAGNGDVIWLEAGSADENTLFDVFARTFDQQHDLAGGASTGRIAALRNFLLDKNSLLVLDNVWNNRALFQLLKAVPPHMPVLITSRHVMPIDGVVLHVAELDADRALELFSYHARKDFTDDADAQALCRQLGNHPFALEIAGKRIKVQHQMTPAQVIESIADAPHQLSLPADFAESGREGVMNLIDDSVHELDANGRLVFREMGGRFVPSGTSELLALSLRQTVEKVENTLNDLQQRGLVQLMIRSGSTRTDYRLHDLIYSYARSMFMQESVGRESFVTAVQEFVTQHAEDYDILEFEQHNILGAAQTAHQLNNNHTFVDIMKVLAVDGEYFAARGHTQTSLQLLQDAIRAAQSNGQQEIQHRLLGKLGDAYRDFYKEYDHALTAYQQALALAPNANREAILLTVIGSTRFLQGADDAVTYYDQAEQIARHDENMSALLVILGHRGYYAMKTQDYQTGWQLLDESVQIAQRVKSHQYHFFSLLNRGECENLQGDFERALATHQEAHQVALAQKNHVWIGHALRDLGEDYHAMGNRVQAQQKLEEALALWQQSRAIAEAAALTRYMEEQGYTVPRPQS